MEHSVFNKLIGNGRQKMVYEWYEYHITTLDILKTIDFSVFHLFSLENKKFKQISIIASYMCR